MKSNFLKTNCISQNVSNILNTLYILNDIKFSLNTLYISNVSFFLFCFETSYTYQDDIIFLKDTVHFKLY